MKLETTFKSKITAFHEAYISAKPNMLATGKLLVELVDENPNAFELILQQCPDVTLGGLELLERVGRGRLLLELAAADDKVSELVVTAT